MHGGLYLFCFVSQSPSRLQNLIAGISPEVGENIGVEKGEVIAMASLANITFFK